MHGMLEAVFGIDLSPHILHGGVSMLGNEK
jgi:hypothetical protein